MAESLAQKQVKIDAWDKKERRQKTLDEIRAELQKKVDAIMTGTRVAQLSGVYGVPGCATQFRELAEKAGGVRLQVMAKVADGEPVYDKKKKKCRVQKYKWEPVSL